MFNFLKEKGNEVNVISASPLRFIIPCFKRLEILGLFNNVFSLEEFNLTKSDEGLFTKLAEKVGAEPKDCVIIDDSVTAIKTAKKVGVQTIGIYEKVVENTWQEMQAVADKTIKSFKELI